MGWTCQHDYQSYCKLVQQPCIPGMKGCTLKQGGVLFAQELPGSAKKEDQTKEEAIDFAALARRH
ncbi:MAG: hypothetical protein DSZ03_00995 [Sulfurimonas sp.]|nr:MAG: hypothetical protein DSZ03_00995 [Sulfurimonas sp.]